MEKVGNPGGGESVSVFADFGFNAPGEVVSKLFWHDNGRKGPFLANIVALCGIQCNYMPKEWLVKSLRAIKHPCILHPGIKINAPWYLAANNERRYYLAMIKSFADKDAARVFAREFVRRLPHDLHAVAWRKLAQIHAATRLESLRVPPGNRLEALKRDRQGQHSIRINDQWRICFVWRDGNAFDVEIVDYH